MYTSGADNASYVTPDCEKAGGVRRDSPLGPVCCAKGGCAPQEADLEGVRLLVLSDPVPLTAQQLQAGEEAVPVVLALSPAVRALRVSGGSYPAAHTVVGPVNLP